MEKIDDYDSNIFKHFPKPKYLVVYCHGIEVKSRLAHDQSALKRCDMKNHRIVLHFIRFMKGH